MQDTTAVKKHKLKWETFWVGVAKIELSIEQFDDEDCDTQVFVEGLLLCTIAGNQREAFKTDFIQLINKYGV